MGGLLQLPPAPRSPRWADSLRAALGKETACQRVTEVLRPYKSLRFASGCHQIFARGTVGVSLFVEPSTLVTSSVLRTQFARSPVAGSSGRRAAQAPRCASS